MQVVIAAIDLADRKLDLALAEGPVGAKSQTAQPPKKGRKKGIRRAKKAGPAKRRRKK